MTGAVNGHDEGEQHEASAPYTFGEVDLLLAEMEALQVTKVLDLARRLHPGLTAEDIRNPHDFPSLDDTDWHYEDGILTGIQAVRSALRANVRARTRGGP